MRKLKTKIDKEPIPPGDYTVYVAGSASGGRMTKYRIMEGPYKGRVVFAPSVPQRIRVEWKAMEEVKDESKP